MGGTMKRFDKGVRYYTEATVKATVHFPEDAVCCGYCEFCYSDSVGRLWCRLTKGQLFSTEYVDGNCPLEFKEETK